ncbi:MAG: sodium-dependent bicarbonate transport family permease [Rhodovarius sp.]|nr:sodium-dependent bicarbonate transport family permease [Rhodovarius sp.]MCX7933421.1 sodium-dependent bicarbonate transport family permease [Rhodovarius sp.]
MAGFDLLANNLLQPIVLAFVLGAIAGFLRSELELPEPVLKLLSIILLFSIGITGGREIAKVPAGEVAGLLALALALTFAIPLICFQILRRLGGFDAANAGAVAAHYGSVSSATFFASIAFARAMATPAEGFLTAVVAMMEFAVIFSIALARWSMGRERGGMQLSALLLDVLRGRGILLLSGGMVIGAVATDQQYAQIQPFWEGMFRGFLMLFLLEMGMTAARQIRGFAEVGRFMLAFGTIMPVCFGLLGVTLGQMAGLSLGGAFVFGAICASASFIDAPAACRAALPEANPGIYLTASLGVTLPFNLLIGLPLYYGYARWLYGA